MRIATRKGQSWTAKYRIFQLWILSRNADCKEVARLKQALDQVGYREQILTRMFENPEAPSINITE